MGMPSTIKARRANLRRIIRERFGDSQSNFSSVTGIALSQLGQWLSSEDSPYSRNMSERSARKIEIACGLPPGSLDLDPTSEAYGSREEEDAGGSMVREPTAEYRVSPPWPFPEVPEAAIRSLTPSQLARVEGAIMGVVSLMGVDLKRPPPPRPAAAPQQPIARGDVDLPFEMRVNPHPDRPSLIEVPGTRGPVRISTAPGVIGADASNEEEFVSVPELDVKLAAGPYGFTNYTEARKGSVAFSVAELRRLGVRPDQVHIVYAKGESMAPVIQDGAPMLFVEDRLGSVRDTQRGVVYAIRKDGEMLVKCIVRTELGIWVARSLNPDPRYHDIALDGDESVRVIGRMVWAGANLRDGVDERLLRR